MTEELKDKITALQKRISDIRAQGVLKELNQGISMVDDQLKTILDLEPGRFSEEKLSESLDNIEVVVSKLAKLAEQEKSLVESKNKKWRF